MENVLDMREYDVPYYVRVSIDTKISVVCFVNNFIVLNTININITLKCPDLIYIIVQSTQYNQLILNF